MSTTYPAKLSTAVIAAALQDHYKVNEAIRFDVVSQNSQSKRRGPKIKKPASEKEYVIRTHRIGPGHSLAKHIGLLSGHCSCATLLSEQHWLRVKRECIQRNDHFMPCPICREQFALQPVVLLSCTHLFHKACLRSFEKFCDKYCCPVCRTADYEKRVVFFTKVAFYHKAATQIQSAWRAHLARKYCSRLRQNAPCPTDPFVRKYRALARIKELNRAVFLRFHEDKEHLVHRLPEHRSSGERSTDHLDALFDDVDHFVNEFRTVMQRWDTKTGQKMVPSTESSKWAIDVRWKLTWELHLRRGTGCCAICLGPWTKRRARVLLTCSHVFHKACLETLEKVDFQPDCHLDTDWMVNICPVCRQTNYEKCVVPRLDATEFRCV